MKLSGILTSGGWLSKKWGLVLSSGGLLIAVVPWLLDIPTIWCLISTFIGTTISLIDSYEAKAKQFEFTAPFTNDPIGWRKAKETYEHPLADEGKSKDDDSR